MFAMFLKLNRKLRMIKKYNISGRPVPVFLLMAVMMIAIGLIPPATHAGSVGLINVKLAPPILIKAAKGSDSNSNSAWNFEDNASRSRAGHSTDQGRKSKYYYAVRTPTVDYNRNQKRPEEEMKMVGMEAHQSLMYGVDLPDFEDLAQQQYFEYLPEVRDQPTNYEASYDRGTNNKRFQYEEEREGESSHPYYGMREEKESAKPIPQRPLPLYPPSAAAAGSKFSYGQEEVDYADLPPPVISHPLPEQAGPSPNNDYRSQRSSRFRQLPAQQSPSSVFRPSQAESLYEYETSQNIIPPNNEQIVGNSQLATTTTPTKNKYPTFHQQIVVNINNHREVQPTDSSLPLQPQQDNVLPSSRPPNEQLSIDNYSVVQRPPNQFIPNPGPGGTNSNFNSRPSLTVQQQYGQSLTPQLQNSGLRLPQSNYGPSRFQSDTRFPMAPNRNMFNMNNNNNNNGARYSHIYRRSPSAPQAQAPTQTAWRPIRSPSNVRHGRFRRSTAPYVSIMDNSFPQSFSMPILSPGYILNRKNVTNKAIPSYAVVDSEFITVRDFNGTDSDFDLLLRKSSAQLQDADIDEDEIASAANLSSINLSEIRNWTAMNFVDKVPPPPILSAHVNNKVPVIPAPADNSAELLNQSSPSSSSLAYTGKNRSFIPLINFSHVIKANGDYNVDFVTGHGISANEMGYRQAEGVSKDPAFIDVESGKGQGKGSLSSEEEESQEKLSNVKLGSISWTSPEGVEFHLSYKADENGYRPTISQSYSSHPGSTDMRRKAQDEIQQN